MSSVAEPNTSVCQPWFDFATLSDCCFDLDTTVDLEVAAFIASDLLYRLSGFRYPGSCELTVRPQLQWRSCFETHEWCSCRPLSKITLAGYPVTEILEVRLDGNVLAADEYRLDRNRELVRLADANGRRQWWPRCSRLDLDDGPGTFFVTYLHGLGPPPGGEEAARELACQVAKALCPTGAEQECDLPPGTARITRQGVTIDIQQLGLWLIGSVRTGMPMVDTFMALHGAPRQKVAALSVPELQFPLRVG